MARTLFIIIILCFQSIGLAQSGRNDKLWSDSWSEKKEIHKSVLEIQCRLDAITTSGGTGCLLEGKSAVTAFHVIDGAEEIRVKFHDGTWSNATIKSFDSATDTAFLEITGDIPESCVRSKLSPCPPECGDDVEVCGLSGGKGLRHFNVKVLGSDSKKLVLSGYVAQGDSGGPIFNVNGEVVGVVSGGSIWVRGKTVDGAVNGAKVTTPIVGPLLSVSR